MEGISYGPDVVILDLGLPDMDGVDIIKKIRSWSHVPIIVVSARTEDQDKVDALDAGADDYLTKPFSIDEFLARIRVAFRRSRTENGKAGEEASVYENGGLKIDYAAGCVYVKGEEIHLTPIEYKLLCLLAQNTGKVLTHNYILKEVWGSALASDIPSFGFLWQLCGRSSKGRRFSPVYSDPYRCGLPDDPAVMVKMREKETVLEGFFQSSLLFYVILIR